MSQRETKGTRQERSSAAGAAGELTAAALFGLLWEGMADVLGTAATATLLRRALKHAAPRHAELSSIVIKRNDFAYEYCAPEAWQHINHSGGVDALRGLVRDLQPLLIEMTGPVVVRRLARVGPLRELGIQPEPTP